MISLRWPIAILTAALGGWIVARGYVPAESRTRNAETRPAGLAVQLRQSAREHAGAGKAVAHSAASVALRVDGDLAAAQEIAARIGAASAGELPGLFAEVNRLPWRSLVRDLAQAALWERCIETGPLEAAEWIKRDAGAHYSEFASAWLIQDQQAASDWLRGENPGEAKLNYILHYANLSASPSLHLALLTDALQPDSLFAGCRLYYSLYLLANRDPAAARRLFESMGPDHPLRGDLAENIAENLAGTNFDTAREWAMQLPEGMREEALYSAMQQAVFCDPERIRRELENTTLPDNRLRDLRRSLIGVLSFRDPEAALEYMRGLPDKAAAESRISFSVPDAPIATLHALWGEWKRAGLDFTMDWNGRDAVSDLRFLSSLPDGPDRTALLDKLMGSSQSWEGLTPADASRLPGEIAGRVAEKRFSNALQRGDVQAAREWSSHFPDPADTRFIETARSAAASPDPAMSQLGQELVSRVPAEKLEILGLIKAQVVFEAEGMDAARNYVLAFPPSERELAFNAIVDRGLEEDESRVAQWQQDIPPGPLQDSYAAAVASHYALTDPSAALTWVRTISSPEERQAAVGRLAQQLLEDDYHSGVQFLDQAGLSAEEQALVEARKIAVKK